jgi:hypothetical protein
MKFLDSLRRTGRTTNMLRAAIRYSDETGRPAFVVAFDMPHLKSLKTQASAMQIPKGGLSFVLHHAVDFDNGQWKVVGADPEQVFVDHHAIERRFSYVLGRLHEYDECAHEPFNDLVKNVDTGDVFCWKKCRKCGKVLERSFDEPD